MLKKKIHSSSSPSFFLAENPKNYESLFPASIKKSFPKKAQTIIKKKLKIFNFFFQILLFTCRLLLDALNYSISSAAP